MSFVSKLSSSDEDLRTEFDQWVKTGRAQELEQHHSYITQQTVRVMDLKSGDRVLDLGCGMGWATSWLAKLVRGNGGYATGLDISDAMIKGAIERARGIEGVSFKVGSAERMPFPDCSFDKVLCVESFYYYPDLRAVLREIHRVMSPGGRLYILNDLYADRLYFEDWSRNLGVPVHVLSEREYVDLLRSAGFGDISALHISDKPTPASKRLRNLLRQPWRKWLPIVREHFKYRKQVTEYRKTGALLLTGSRAQSNSLAHGAWDQAS